MPDVVGNLEGLPYTARATANDIYLKNQLADAQADLEAAKLDTPDMNDQSSVEDYLKRIADRKTRVDALDNIQVTLGADDRFLISLSNDVPPLAAIAIGNPDDATNITYAVPGMGTDSTGMDAWTSSAQALHDQQVARDGSREHSVIAWVGYETPPTGGAQVMGMEYAEAGATKLDASITGMQTVRGDAATLNVAAHSYGTTTSSIALTQLDRPVNSFVSVGSAGLPGDIDQASDLQAGQVFAGQANSTLAAIPDSGDAWAWFGRLSPLHPVNPAGSGFGADVFGVGSADGLNPVRDHGAHTEDGGGYFDRGTQSLRNIALATTGQGDQITHDPTPSPSPMLPIGTR